MSQTIVVNPYTEIPPMTNGFKKAWISLGIASFNDCTGPTAIIPRLSSNWPQTVNNTLNPSSRKILKLKPLFIAGAYSFGHFRGASVWASLKSITIAKPLHFKIYICGDGWHGWLPVGADLFPFRWCREWRKSASSVIRDKSWLSALLKAPLWWTGRL